VTLQDLGDARPPEADVVEARDVLLNYCASGGRSALAGKTLKDMGYQDVRNLVVS
jgi:rhodanese-related sulfurtransferase